MSSPRTVLVLWVVQTIIMVVTAGVLYKRKLHKEFPAFFTFLVAQGVIFCVQMPVYSTPPTRLYFAVYWSAAAVNLVLAFKIIHEIFLDVFKPYHALRDLGTALFRWAAIVTVLLSAVVIVVRPGWDDPLATSILVVQRCVSVVQCGMVIFLLAFCKNLGVSWKRMSFGIALGFGIMSASELLTFGMYSGGRIHLPILQVALLGTDVLGICVWLLYSLMNRRRDLVPVLVPQRWNEALMDIQAPPAETDDSLIPMFEHMVDQALSKTNSH